MADDFETARGQTPVFSLRRLWPLAVLLAGFLAFFILDLDRYLSFDALRDNRILLREWTATNPWLSVLVYAAVYIAVVSFSLPGSTLMTISGGFLFGPVIGTATTVFAATSGAVILFVSAKTVFGDVLRAKAGPAIRKMEAEFRKNELSYMFVLRLVPLFPFFVINLLMGLTKMKAGTFYWVSQLGMLAGTLVYVNAGTQLAKIESLAGIVSPGLLASFVLLGLFPLIAKKIVDAVKARRVYAKWADRKPRKFDRNMVVIGAGAAGLVSSYIAAVVKAKVTLVEQHKMGGDCLNYGCVPSKALIKTATLVRQMRHSAEYGVKRAEYELDFAQVMERVASVVKAVEPHDSVERYTGLGVDVQLGRALILDPWHVQITKDDASTSVLSTRSIVIATGAAPFVPPLPGLEEVGYRTSDTLWDLRELPRRLVVLGGGPIGCELAQAFARLGSQVTQIEMLPRIMVREDEEVSQYARGALESDGVTVLTGHKALRCGRDGGGEKWIEVEAGGSTRRIAFDLLLCAVGRVARLSGFGLEELGIPAQRTVVTDEYLQTIYPNILAAGDVAGPFQFTHTAGHQAWYAAVNGLFGTFRRFKADYSVVPWCTFIDPEVARVGLNEQEAKEKGVAYEMTRYGIDDLDRAIADSAAHGWVKVLTVPGKDRILGVTIVGVHAGDLLADIDKETV
ncbi:MAG TPA: pyridine nucleotide-disulfide oxidoreductase, partial [Alphaproteobacteria bacterium]|nr:pyridine nucleotide-disulfide oxidoreductase [Alphaproteobacteria bacterium]